LFGGLLWLGDHGVTLLEQLHVEISFGRPARAGYVAQPGGGEVDGGVAIRERADRGRFATASVTAFRISKDASFSFRRQKVSHRQG
jgi:hypothetical protein